MNVMVEYIRNWSLQPFSPDHNLSAHITIVVCRFRTTDLWESFNDNFIYSQSFCQKSAEVRCQRKIFYHILVLMSDLETEPRPHVQYVNTLPARLRRLIKYGLAKPALMYQDTPIKGKSSPIRVSPVQILWEYCGMNNMTHFNANWLWCWTISRLKTIARSFLQLCTTTVGWSCL